MNELYESGLCTGADVSDLFFSENVADLSQAQVMCAACDVQLACLETALEQEEEWGVWGGVIFWDGVPFYRKRGRGRPRKDESTLPIKADRSQLWELVKSA